MIAKITILISFIVLSSSLFGQTKKLYIGLEFMPTVATQLSPKLPQKMPLRFSLSGGINVSYKFGRSNIYLKSGVYLLNKGYGYTVDVINPQGQVYGKYRHTEHLNYLSVPVNLGFNFNNLYFEFGPSINYFIFRRQKQDATVKDKTPPTDINKLNFGGNLSFGTIIYPNSRRKTYNIILGGYASVTSGPIFLNAGVKMGLNKRLK